MNEQPLFNQKDRWDKLKIISAFLASVFVPLALGLVGHWYTNAWKQADSNLRYSELAIDILKQPMMRENNAIRDWAIDIVDKNSGVSVSPTAREALKTQPIIEMERFLSTQWAPEFINTYVARIIDDDKEWSVFLAMSADQQKKHLASMIANGADMILEKYKSLTEAAK